MESLEGLVGSYLAVTRTRKQDLADAVGCSLVTFNKKLRGDSDLTITDARRLARAMGKSCDEICHLAP